MKGCSGHSTGSMIRVPTLGSVINEFYSTILKPPLSKRTGEFSIVIEERLLKLERDRWLQDSKLSAKPIFINIFMQAYQIALRHHHEEKLEALRNAVINIDIGIEWRRIKQPRL